MRISTLAIAAAILAGGFGIALAAQTGQPVAITQTDAAAAPAADDQPAAAGQDAAQHKVLTVQDFGENEGGK
ncbi:MAG: hypothetical protein ABI399_06645, partial [Bauldia sp.]